MHPFIITNSGNQTDLYVGDKVYLINSSGFREGPYVIATIPSPGKYTLSRDNGIPVRDGDEIGADSIERVD